MRRLEIIGCLVPLFVQLTVVQDAIAGDDLGAQSALDAQLVRLEATVDEDIVVLRSLLEDDLTYSHTTGFTETKSGFLSTVESRRVDYVSARPREVAVRIYGDTAVITGLLDLDLEVGGKPTSFTIKFLEVSRRMDDTWRLVAWQSVRYTAD